VFGLCLGILAHDSIKRERALQLTCVKGLRFHSRRLAGIDPQRFGSQEVPACRNAGLQLAYAKRSEHRATSRDILLHEPFERFGDPMDRMWRHKPEALCEFPIGRRAPGLGLIEEDLAETILQHDIATSLRASTHVLGRAQEAGDVRRPVDFAGEHT
jgi:hypothetical protein